MVNLQPAEPLDRREDGSLDVFKVWLTLQGEGPFAGTPAVFVRLAGCNLQCGANSVACDTDYTSVRERLTPGTLLPEVLRARGTSAARLVVLTGGEPFRQSLTPFIGLLAESRFDVQVETNGTLFDPVLRDGRTARWPLTVVCSPKTPRLNTALAEWTAGNTSKSCYKYVLEAGRVADDGLPTSVLGEEVRPARPPAGFPTDRIFVQPVDVQEPDANRANVRAAVDSCLRFGYRLSLQQHKLLGLE